MKVPFRKMHGAGNDFVMIDNRNGKYEISDEQVRFLCNRQLGVGADAVIMVESRDDGSEAFLYYRNADGSFSEMCANGIRCIADMIIQLTGFKGDKIKIGSHEGIKTVKVEGNGMFTANMGKPNFESNDFPTESFKIDGHELHFVSMGNPHAVAFVHDVDAIDLETLGPKVENDSHFPNRTNFEIIQKIGPNKLKKRVWERGSGITLCCGSGTCASYAISKKLGLIDGKTEIEVPGGVMYVDEDTEGNLLLSGPSETVYKGEIELN